jgi:O-antigen/teichoic acid export membrane protein
MLISLLCAALAIVLGWKLVQVYGLIGLATAYAVSTIVQQISMWIAVRVQVGVWTHPGLSFIRPIMSCNRNMCMLFRGDKIG